MDQRIPGQLPLWIRGKKGRISLRASIGGRQRWVALGIADKRQAEKLARRFLKTAEIHGFDAAKQELNGAELPPTGNCVTFDQISRLFGEFCETQFEVNRPAKATQAEYLNSLKKLMSWGNAYFVHELDGEALYKDWRAANPTQKETTYVGRIKKAASVFKERALAYYKKRGYPVSNPFKDVQIPRQNLERYKPLDEKRRRKIWEGEGLLENQKMIIRLALGPGLRAGEIKMARPEWLTSNSLEIPSEEDGWRPKGRRGRSVSLGEKSIAMLRSMRGGSDSPFLVPGNGAGLNDRLKSEMTLVIQWLHNAGIKERKALHSLRKEAGSLMATNHPQGLFAAKEFLGHSSVRVTEQYYAHLIDPQPYEPLDVI